MEVIYHRLVVRDLRMALNYYETEGGTKLADRFFAEVEEGVAKIIASPWHIILLMVAIVAKHCVLFPTTFSTRWMLWASGLES
ncbi:MAG: hypothetical protein H8M99_15765 [Gloeobacteraceae cyanobacterium ES-bin-144]|nr:hypothetical protein [Verrucomicrobiales bacterium]